MIKPELRTTLSYQQRRQQHNSLMIAVRHITVLFQAQIQAFLVSVIPKPEPEFGPEFLEKRRKGEKFDVLLQV